MAAFTRFSLSFIRILSNGNETFSFVHHLKNAIRLSSTINRNEKEEETRHANEFPQSKLRRQIPKKQEDVDSLRGLQVDQPRNPRLLRVALLGLPNSGKSTLTNRLMGWRICSVSKKVHTTRHNSKAVYVEGNTQIIFIDTPGLVNLSEKKRFQLGQTLAEDPFESMKEADLAVVLVDACNKWERLKLPSRLLNLLNVHRNKKSVLVLNKIDLLKRKSLLLDITWSLTKGFVDGKPINRKSNIQMKKNEPKTGNEIILQMMEKLNMVEKSEADIKDELEKPNGWPHFERVFMISAESNEGVDDLKSYLLASGRPHGWIYNSSLVTDQSPAEIVLMAVREKLLDYLPQEIPYNLKLKIEMWEVDENGILRLVVLIRCPKSGIMKLIIGPQGKKISQIADEARQELMNTFRCDVALKLIVEDEKSTK